ncbi:hypothetical protein DFP91_5774 [Pseudorhodoplanes sinuspersici]|nr:hypothetical protein DFP91_5774 [Pseudorhodoplanes sinuspersici]
MTQGMDGVAAGADRLSKRGDDAQRYWPVCRAGGDLITLTC